MVYDFLFLALLRGNTYRQQIEHGNMTTHAPEHHCCDDDGTENGKIDADSPKSGRHTSRSSEDDTVYREENRVGQIGKIRMTSQEREKRVECGGIPLESKDGEKEYGGRNSVENASRTELMCGENCLQQGGTREYQVVVVTQQEGKGQPEAAANDRTIFLHKIPEFITVDGKPSSQQEDEEVVKHPIVQTIEKERLQQGILRKVGNEVIKGSVEAGKVIKGDLKEEQDEKIPLSHVAHHGDPEGHEQVEPEEDHQKVKVVLGESEEQELCELPWPGNRDAVKEDVDGDVKEGPKKIGNEHRTETALHELQVAKGLVYIEIVKETKGRDEKEDGDAKTGEHFEKRYQVKVGGGIFQVLGSNVDANDAHHGNAAYVLNGGKTRFFQRKDSLLKISMDIITAFLPFVKECVSVPSLHPSRVSFMHQGAVKARQPLVTYFCRKISLIPPRASEGVLP